MSFRLRPSGALRLLPLLLLGSPAYAADAMDLPFAEDAAVPAPVLSATRLSQSLFETPAAVTVIDRQMIEQSGVREIPELLRLVPGMVVAYDTGYDAYVSFHGTAVDLARRMQVLVDGRSIYQPLLASVDWIGLPLELADIERIEVIRGPNSSTWGANSFFAVVNIITRHPADVERARVSYTRGEDGVEDFLARVAQRTGQVDWRLTVAGRSDDGFEANLDPSKQAQGKHEFTDSKRIRSVYGRGVLAPDPSRSVELAFGFARNEMQQQYRPDFFVQSPLTERENDYGSLAIEQDVGEGNRLRFQASHSRFRRDEPWLVNVPRLAFNPVLGELYEQNPKCANGFALGGGDTSACTADDVPLLAQLVDLLVDYPGNTSYDPLLEQSTLYRSGLDSHERRTTIELHDVWVMSTDLRAVAGVTYDKARVDSDVYLGGFGENTVWRVFGHAEWRIAPEWLLNVGGNHEYDQSAGNYFSPRYALNWQFSSGHVLRAVYSEAVRTPDLLEEEADFHYTGVAVAASDAAYSGVFFQTGKGDSNAPTEEIHSHEIGYYGRFDDVRVTLDLRGFRDRMFLTEHSLDPTEGDGFLITPVEKMWLSGGELGMDWRPFPSQRFQLNYAYLDIDGVDESDDNTVFVPQHSGSVGWWQDYGNGWQFGSTYAFYNNLRYDTELFFDRLENRLARKLNIGPSQQLVLAAVMQTRLTDDPELRRENGGDRHRGWFSLDWHY